MPKKPSGEVKTDTVERKRSNGDTSVYERQYQHDPDTKRSRQIVSRLLGKKVRGSEEIAPTKPKRKHAQKPEDAAGCSSVAASRLRVGMMEILDHMGKASGIDALLYAHTDPGTA